MSDCPRPFVLLSKKRGGDGRSTFSQTLYTKLLKIRVIVFRLMSPTRTRLSDDLLLDGVRKVFSLRWIHDTLHPTFLRFDPWPSNMSPTTIIRSVFYYRRTKSRYRSFSSPIYTSLNLSSQLVLTIKGHSLPLVTLISSLSLTLSNSKINPRITTTNDSILVSWPLAKLLLLSKSKPGWVKLHGHRVDPPLSKTCTPDFHIYTTQKSDIHHELQNLYWL